MADKVKYMGFMGATWGRSSTRCSFYRFHEPYAKITTENVAWANNRPLPDHISTITFYCVETNVNAYRIMVLRL